MLRKKDPSLPKLRNRANGKEGYRFRKKGNRMMGQETLFCGIDIGSSTVKTVVCQKNGNVVSFHSIAHYGAIFETTKREMKQILLDYGNLAVALTGTHSQVFGLGTQSEIPSLVEGTKKVYPSALSVIEIGNMNGRYVTNLNDLPIFAVSQDCAGGTGSFFEDQMSRLGLELEEYSNLVKNAHTVPRLSGRCSVFAKTDIIHRQQEGVPIPDILQGLCHATMKNFKSTVMKNLPIPHPLALGGGIIHNQGVIRAVKELLELDDREFLCREEGEFLQAIGAAFLGKQEGITLEQGIKQVELSQEQGKSSHRLSPLVKPMVTPLSDSVNYPNLSRLSLGIDIGSTSTNLVLVNANGELVDVQYLRTKGAPEAVVRHGLLQLQEKFGDKLEISSVGVTGSGRYMIGKLIGADCIKDEITAQGKGAVMANPLVDTVFEIGGQDSKYIKITDGQVVDFTMNKICAAGTGSFLEEQALRFQVKVEDYGDLALKSKNPVFLGDRCTVFIETSIQQQLSSGADVCDILAGLCHSVISNYLSKVVGNKKVGEHIVLQGGVCYNKAVVAAFQQVYGEKVTVSPYFSVSGAYGVAILAQEEQVGESKFHGLDLSKEKSQEVQEISLDISKNIELFEKPRKLLLKGYTRNRDQSKPTIGVPFSLLVYKFFPMMRNFFETLGFNVLLSPESNEEIITLAQKYCNSETCYPVKLMYGHMAWLAEEKVDYIFMPNVHTMKHMECKARYQYGCVYMQSAPKMIYDTMKLAEKQIALLNPTFRLDFGQQAMGEEMIKTGVSLGKAKALCVAALGKGGIAVKQNIKEVEKAGRELLANIKPDDKVLVMITRTYGIEDPVLNMNIPYELLKRGYKVIALGHLEAYDVDIDGEYENMYWPFGRHITSGARIIAQNPNLFPIFLTNHGCAPDSVIAHFFKEEIGDKPYLNIEVDEHYSKVGVITRIEAFLNSIEKAKPYRAAEISPVDISTEIPRNQKIYLPNLSPYSQVMAQRYEKKGYLLAVPPPSTPETLALGSGFTTTKEYVTLTALMGDVQRITAEEKGNPCFFVPQTEGSEIEGMYPRLLRCHVKNIGIVTKTLETLPFTMENFEDVFLSLLVADMTGYFEDKDRLWNLETKEEFFLFLRKTPVIFPKKDRKKVYLVGDFYMVYQDALCKNIWKEIEQQGKHHFVKMPFSEYLLFLWSLRAETDKEKEVIRKYQEQIHEIHLLLGEHSPFDEISTLLSTAKDLLGDYNGANGAYRLAKMAVNKADAVIDVAPMYENTQTILELTGKNLNKPAMFAHFEEIANSIQKIEGFLYYI